MVSIFFGITAGAFDLVETFESVTDDGQLAAVGWFPAEREATQILASYSNPEWNISRQCD